MPQATHGLGLDEGGTPPVRSWKSSASTVSLVLACLLSFQPLKSLPFVLPYLLMGIYLVASHRLRLRIPSRRMLTTATATVFAWLALILVHALIQPRFSFLAATVSLITYGPILFLLATPWSLLEQSPAERQQFVNIAAWVLLFQSCVGIVQGLWSFSQKGTFLGSTGDAVEGTIRLALEPSGSFGNPMFAANVAFLLLVVLPPALLAQRSRLLVAASVAGCIALTLASVVHILLFFGAAVGVGALAVLSRQRRKAQVRMAAFALMGVVGAASLIGPNVLSITTFSSMFLNGRLPRAEVLNSVVAEMPREYPHAPLLGLGSGQFSSRAGMATAGMYATQFSAFVGEPTDPQRQFLINPYLRSLQGHPMGSTGQPLSSWLSMYSEFGVVVVLALLVWGMASVLRRCRAFLAAGVYAPAWTGLSAAALFFLMGFQENYWETAQAVMIGALAIKSQPSLGAALHNRARSR